MDELGPHHAVTRIMHGAPFTPTELAEGVRAVRGSAGFARAYADARAQALDALEYLRPFPRNRYRRALEEIALHVVDREF
jgi:heptaprenyl diphosphate synthase